MKLTDFFDRARRIVTGHHVDRDVKRDGGEYETQWGHIARVYSALTGQPMTEQDALAMMQCVKLVRAQRDPKFNPDHYDDLIGYTALAGMARFNQQGSPTDGSSNQRHVEHLGDFPLPAFGVVSGTLKLPERKHDVFCTCPACVPVGAVRRAGD